MLLWYIYVTCNKANNKYQFLKEIIFQTICTFFRTLHINAALKQKNARLFVALFERTVLLYISQRHISRCSVSLFLCYHKKILLDRTELIYCEAINSK
jgi:hypothetical protein